MNKKILIGVIIVILIVVGLFTLNSFSVSGLLIGSAIKEPVIIGTIFPQSGALSYIGPLMAGGVSIASEEINQAGGINGHKLEVIFEDSQSATATGVTSYQKLSSIDGVKYYIVGLSGVTLGIAPLAEKEKNLVLNTGSYAQGISIAGDYTFRHNILPQDEVSFLSEAICKKFGFKKVAVIYANNEAGISIKNLFHNAFSSCGEIVIEETYDVAGKDFRTELTKINLANPQAIFAITYSNESGLLFNQAKEIGLEKQWFAVSAIESKSFLEVAGENAERLIYSSFPIKTTSTKYILFRENYLKKYGQEPDFLSALSYDSTHILAEAMKQCSNPNDTTCVKNELYKIQNYDGITGLISFDENGDTKKEVILKTIKNGEFVLYEAN